MAQNLFKKAPIGVVCNYGSYRKDYFGALNYSHRLLFLLVGCIETEGLHYEILNAISTNRYKRLDISETMENVQPLTYLFQQDTYPIQKEVK